MKRMPRWLIVVLSLLTMAAALGFLFFRDALMLRLADARTDKLGLWIYNPYAAPGEALDLEVGLYGGLKAGIDRIEARLGDQRVPVRGDGADWGSTISSRAGSSGHDAKEFQIKLPADVAPDAQLVVEVRVDYVLANSTSYGSFSNRRGSDQVFATLTVHGEAGRFWGRLLFAGLALGALGLYLGLCVFTERLFARYAQDGDAGETLGVGLVIGMIVAGYLGYWFFALPLVRATDLSADWFVIVSVLIWSVGPPILGWRINRGRTRQAQYRLLAVGTLALPGAPERWAEMLRSEGLRVEVRGRRLRGVMDGSAERITLKLPRRMGFTLDQVGLRADGTQVVLAAALALARALGPLRLQVASLVLDVGGSERLVDLEQVYAERMMAAAREMMAALERTAQLLERVRTGKPPPGA